MTAAVVAAGAVAAVALAGTGGWLIYTSASPGSIPPRTSDGMSADRHRTGSVAPLDLRNRPRSAWSGTGQRQAAPPTGMGATPGRWIPNSGLLAAVGVVAAAGGLVAWLLFGGLVPTVVAAVFAGTFPVAGDRRRAQARIDEAAAEWPRVLEEIRLRTGSLGRSVPQAVFDAGRSAPMGWRPVFDAAEREWLLTVDFARTATIIKAGLADPTADAVCETLLMAHEIGGTDLDAKLAELIEDRVLDLESRRDAASRLAGVRFARRFVLLVPLGMALAGLTIGTGRHAYQTAGGQIAVVVGLAAVAACWWWSGRLMRLPGSRRVFR